MSRWNTISASMRRALATGGVAAVALSGIVLAATPEPPPAQAQEQKISGVDVKLEKINDGTEHGTNNQTFINSGNGFAVGDNTPTDGIVSVGDTVTYEFSMSFVPGPARTLVLDYNSPNPALKVQSTNICEPGVGYSASMSGAGKCVIAIKAGANGSVTRQVLLQAVSTDTDLTDPIRYAVTTNAGSASADQVRVVQAPRFDISVSHGNQVDMETGMGKMDISKRQATLEGFSPSKGYAPAEKTPGSVIIDVSKFPSGTTFPGYEVKNGTITVPMDAYNMNVPYQVPLSALEGKELSMINWEYSIKTEPGQFSIGGQQNFQNGIDPGSGQDKNTSTYDKQQGTLGGVYYPNNNYGKVNAFVRPKGIATKDINAPAVNGTIYDQGSLTFDQYHSSRRADGGSVPVAAGTELESIINVPRSIIEANTKELVIADAWSTDIQKFDLKNKDRLGVEGVDPKNVTLKFSESATISNGKVDFGDLSGSQWTTTPTEKTVAVIAIVKLDTLPEEDMALRIPQKMLGSYKGEADGMLIPDYYAAVQSDTPGIKKVGSNSIDSARLGVPKEPEPVVKSSGDNIIKAGTLTTRRISPQVQNLSSIDRAYEATIVETLDRCFTRVSFPSSVTDEYNITWENQGQARCGDDSSPQERIVFTLKKLEKLSNVNSASTGSGNLPYITYSGYLHAMTPLADEPYTLTNNTEMTINGQKEPVIPARSSSTSTALQRTDVGTDKSAIRPKVEMGDEIGWTLTAVNQTGSSAGDTRFVDILPYNGSPVASLENGRTTQINGNITLSKAEVVTNESAPGTFLEYTSHDRMKLDPKNPNQSGVSWTRNPADLGGIEKVTAIRVTIPDFGARGSVGAVVNMFAKTPGSRGGDIIVNQLGESASVNQGLNVPSPGAVDVNVVDSSLSGKLFWDENRDGQGQGEDPIPGVRVTLVRLVDKDNPTEKTWTTTTNEKGEYSFSGLHSGSYEILIPRGDGSDQVKKITTTQYGKTENVDITRSGSAFLNAARDNQREYVSMETDKKNVDFGYYVPNPEVKVDKSIVSQKDNGDGSRDVEYSVTVVNTGNTPMDNVRVNDLIDKNHEVTDEFLTSLGSDNNIKDIYRTGWGSSAMYVKLENGDLWCVRAHGGGAGCNEEVLAPETIARNANGFLYGKMNLPAGVEFVDVAMGVTRYNGNLKFRNFALSTDGKVYQWGTSAGDEGGSLQEVEALKGMKIKSLYSPGNSSSSNGFYLTDYNNNTYFYGAPTAHSGVGFEYSHMHSNEMPEVLLFKIPNMQGKPIKTMRSASQTMAWITEDGEAYIWGYIENHYPGSFGLDEKDPKSLTKIVYEPLKVTLPNEEKIQDVVFIDYNSGYYLTKGGKVYSFGVFNGKNIELVGNKDFIDGSSHNEWEKVPLVMPREVNGFGRNSVSDLMYASYSDYTNSSDTMVAMALTEDGTVWEWGKIGGEAVSSPREKSGLPKNISDFPDLEKNYTQQESGVKGDFVIISDNDGIPWAWSLSGKPYSKELAQSLFGIGVGEISDPSIPRKVTTIATPISKSLRFEYYVTSEQTSFISKNNIISVFGYTAARYYPGLQPSMQASMDMHYLVSSYPSSIVRGKLGGRVPISTESTQNIDAEHEGRTYNIGTLRPGEKTVITLSTKVPPRIGKEYRFPTNQVFVTSDSTPPGERFPDIAYGTVYTYQSMMIDSKINGADLYANDNVYSDTDRYDGTTFLIMDKNPSPSDPTPPETAVLSGKAWKDTNNNGIQDKNETDGIPGVKVIIWQGTEQVAEVTTGADGKWSVTVPKGALYSVSYDVASFPMDHTVSPTKAAGSTPATDSDGVFIQNINLNANTPNLDLGLVPFQAPEIALPNAGTTTIGWILASVAAAVSVGMAVLSMRRREE